MGILIAILTFLVVVVLFLGIWVLHPDAKKENDHDQERQNGY